MQFYKILKKLFVYFVYFVYSSQLVIIFLFLVSRSLFCHL